jgi:asparagine synthase (glutamine-hydrolysing)
MCGIAGLVWKDLSEESVLRFHRACGLMQHRGPDHTGVLRQGNLFLLHHRLSILDLDARANQPFWSNDRQVCAIFNGEIYNHRELAQQLQLDMRTSSDTEVLVESFARRGSDSFGSWNGMFAAAIHEPGRQRLHLTRDRFGIKPLYYFEGMEFVAFASEAKVIMEWLPRFELSSAALSQYMWFGNTTGADTLAKGLRKLRPGEHLEISTARAKITTRRLFWSMESPPLRVAVRMEDAAVEVRARLATAVKRQLAADVPVGILLSGGIDSSSIVAVAAPQASAPLATYCVDYDHNIGGKSELPKARLVAARYGTNHHEIRITSDDVPDVFDRLVYQYDEPFADAAAIPLFQLARTCSSQVKVILQGDGGDEVFGGYRRYAMLQHRRLWALVAASYRFLPAGRLRERARRIRHVLSQREKGALFATYLTQDVAYHSPYRMLDDTIAAACAAQDWQHDYITLAAELNGGNLAEDMRLADMRVLLPNTYLEKVDKVTMACSLEARVPFLDNDLVDFANALPISMKVRGTQYKRVLRAAMRDALPSEILDAPKRGFDVPYRQWLRGPLYDYAHDCFAAMDNPFLDRARCLAALRSHRSREPDQGPLLWKALVLATWLKHYGSRICGIDGGAMT